ncbi:DUF190 domain-containing protein [Xanthomonas oryzae]|uniref:DUF190 domain-containing protein n=1 Tax=Xanthomonas oryzae TaxID=347 RepID=UPI0006434C4F|nr:DUF190 domain-containing protein [Xanthomonas oryzae]AKK64109.1 hypothetical protein FE36_09830 [Xanthomonas oryzae pv. oryzicola]AKO00783.1 hypothetical protein ACU15_10030 [Xanthomonas oryzae pv. oryzicola]KOR45042.1 hypothetical protein ADT27_13060 [Xanthomonas oryzae]MEC5079014.1 DUF190 domain-containing protein [Xanthomonas oryzae pv. oryzicola]MEC5113218.1 DUF190 domain-containing protein [Xanthomonas oryzae pv. oryzicola]
MKGYQLTFFTSQGARHGHAALCDWVLETARDCGGSGGTVVSGQEGFGHAGLLHSAGFFELADQPLTIMICADASACERLFARIANEDVALPYVKTPVEFGRVGRLTLD